MALGPSTGDSWPLRPATTAVRLGLVYEYGHRAPATAPDGAAIRYYRRFAVSPAGTGTGA